MVEAADQELKRWAREILPSAKLRLTAPGRSDEESCVYLYLTELRPAPPTLQPRRPSLAVTLCYLITAISGDTEEAHRMLGQLLFAAMAHEHFEVDLQSVTTETWRAFGIAPQPAFLLRFPFSLERTQPLQRVMKRPTIRPVAPAPFAGILLGPCDTPIPGAHVTLLELGMSTSTDSDGCFHFAAVPSGPEPKRLRIQAKGLEVEKIAAPSSDRTREPVVIRFNELEE